MNISERYLEANYTKIKQFITEPLETYINTKTFTFISQSQCLLKQINVLSD